MSTLKKQKADGSWEFVTTGLTDYVRHPVYAVTTGSTNTYVATVSPAMQYVDGEGITVKFNIDSTGASTLNGHPLKNSLGSDLLNIKAGSIYTFRYNSATGNFIMQGEGVDATSLITATNSILGM